MQTRNWLPLAALSFVVGLVVAAVPVLIVFERGGNKMETPALPVLLKRVDKTKVGAMDAFAASLLAGLRDDPRSLAALTASRDKDLAVRAREVFLGMEDTIVWPSANAGTDMDVADRLWLTGVAVRSEVRLRRTLAATLEKLLTDTTLIPQEHTPGSAEESPPSLRVCDQAYLQLRELLQTTEGSDKGMLNRDRFLAEPFDERDAELKKFLKSREFTDFMDESASSEE